jgi:hypothetical protein
VFKSFKCGWWKFHGKIYSGNFEVKIRFHSFAAVLGLPLFKPQWKTALTTYFPG